MNNPTKNYCSKFNQPRRCLLCLRKTVTSLSICSDCKTDLPWLGSCCNHCAIPLSDNTRSLTCPDCLKKRPPFSSVSAAFEYRFPIDQLIQQAKFNQQTWYLQLMASLLTERVMTSDLPDLLIPVPLHKSRMRERQYNQSALLARHLSRQLGIPMSNTLLTKIRNTPHQADLERKHRKHNIQHSFACCEQPPEHVAVVDDVITTGATASEASKVLLRAGCLKVSIWAIARTPKTSRLT